MQSDGQRYRHIKIFILFLVDSKGKANCSCTVFYTGSKCDNCTCQNEGECVQNDGKTSCRYRIKDESDMRTA